jgi:hypothetical protein
VGERGERGLEKILQDLGHAWLGFSSSLSFLSIFESWQRLGE